MDHQARCAFIIAQAACANAEIAAMQAHNQQCEADHTKYTYNEFMEIQNKYMIGHNTVIEYLRGG